MEHVRVGHDDLAGGPDRRADGGRRIAVVCRGRDGQFARQGQGPQLGDLVLPERLRRKEEQRACRGIVGECLEDRDRVAERLPRRRRRNDHDVLMVLDGLDRRGLVGIERFDPAAAETPLDAGIQPLGERQRLSGAGWDDLVVDDSGREQRLLEETGQHGICSGGGISAHGPASKANNCST